MLDNLEGSITLLQSAMDGVKISFGERLSPYVRGIADWLTEQMPEVEQGLNEMMDWVDSKVDRMKRKFKELSQSDEWKNADFFGKVKLAWDDFIAEPFSEWWHSTGKQKIADIAGDMGTSIGTGLKLGILTLLGVDVSDTLNELSLIHIYTSKARFRMQGIWKTVQVKWRQDRMWKKSKKRHCRK